LFLLASDLDGTLLPNSGADYDKNFFDRFIVWLEERRPRLKLAYITGRHLELALQGIGEYRLPEPDYLVGDVGASIYMKHRGEWRRSSKWDAQISQDFHDHSQSDIQDLLADIPELELQEEKAQGRFKISYYFDSAINPTDLQDKIDALLRSKGPKLRVITSIDPVTDRGLLDILPKQASKEEALKFLIEALNLSKGGVMYCGDTGNDLLPLTSGYPAVLVGNASPEVEELVRQKAKERKAEKFIFYATKPYAEGIAQALYHFGFSKKPIE
jgi:sucrose-6F-phosphate phosphohydrolase